MYGKDRVIYSYVARCLLASLPLRGVGGRTGFMARAPLVLGPGESWAESYPSFGLQSVVWDLRLWAEGQGTETVSFAVLFRGSVSFGRIVSVLSGYWRRAVHYGMIEK